MPGRVFLSDTPAATAAALSARPRAAESGPRPDAAPGESLPVLIAEDGARVLCDMRWSMVMSGRVNARGRPVMETIVNARSETVFEKSAFAGTGRAVLPVGGWYEWTGKARAKTRWRISDPAQPLLLFAAIFDVWTGPGGVRVYQMATLTCAPNSDLAPIHHRMPVILPPEAVDLWLGPEGAEAVTPLLVPWPDGRLSIEKAAPS